MYGINRLKLDALNTVLRSEGLTEIGMIHSQGVSFGLSHYLGGNDEGEGRMIKNYRFVITQSSSLMNSNLRSTYVLWYDENEISMGRHFTLGIGGYTGYVRHELKKFTGMSGGFINQDQPNIKVVNPAYVYGFSISPTLRFGNLYARASAGYGWDWGKKTWNYQGSPMNTAGGIKSTGLFMSAEIGYCYRFDIKSKKMIMPWWITPVNQVPNQTKGGLYDEKIFWRNSLDGSDQFDGAGIAYTSGGCKI